MTAAPSSASGVWVRVAHRRSASSGETPAAAAMACQLAPWARAVRTASISCPSARIALAAVTSTGWTILSRVSSPCLWFIQGSSRWRGIPANWWSAELVSVLGAGWSCASMREGRGM
ncbi:Uncharacterised protein [Mycobacteroides abscessus subsp. abscessus]|nr:Uncharacterised protein [Mycobacteroides abscessus subsp. abscessus]